jgi:predicted Fe-Mo cluster-binding NifX family protein
MKKIFVAFATDDGATFINRHFGDARFFDIYEVRADGIEFFKRINNTSPKEKVHSDPEKAKEVGSLLLAENVKVVAARIFGPNLNRIKKKFVCVIFKSGKISSGSNAIFRNLGTILRELEKGEKREYLIFE